MMKKEKKMKRMASLLEKGLDQTTATSTIDKFESDADGLELSESYTAIEPPPIFRAVSLNGTVL